MAFLLVPLEVFADRAVVWIGGVNEAFRSEDVRLVLNASNYPLNPAQWARWTSSEGTVTITYQRLSLTNLQPASLYLLELLIASNVLQAALRTLPDQLPSLDQKPFTVLLASCFCESEDPTGSVGLSYFHLPSGARPDIKILCGDQVYLDAPWTHYFWATHNLSELESEFVERYLRTWCQIGDASGFNRLLSDRGNFFCPEDHEFWNNYPNMTPAVRDSWTLQGRRDWERVGRALYRIFQSQDHPIEFQIGKLSFFVSDTRSNRATDRTQFMCQRDFNQLRSWVHRLSGPGVLVIGQPLFTPRTVWAEGTFRDWNLADYEQYDDLARLVVTSRHTFLVLTGDAHFSRMAHCTLASGTELIEVVSSPLALVSRLAGGKWEAAPPVFPSFEIAGVQKVPITTMETLETFTNNFLTLEFAASGGRIKFSVWAWDVVTDGDVPRGRMVCDRWIQ